jgi:hypothetical protein
MGLPVSPSLLPIFINFAISSLYNPVLMKSPIRKTPHTLQSPLGVLMGDAYGYRIMFKSVSYLIIKNNVVIFLSFYLLSLVICIFMFPVLLREVLRLLFFFLYFFLFFIIF